MKRKPKVSAKEETLSRALDRETRQEAHQTTELVEPPTPPDARWQVFEWCVRIGNWQHLGYAATESKRKSLADQARALGGKVRIDKLTPRQPRVQPRVQSRLGRNVVVVRDQRHAGPASTTGPGIATDLQRSLLSSLSLWINEAWCANVLSELPVDTIRAARDACKSAVQARKGRAFRPSRTDPFARLERSAR